jgi:hypothetical protein
MLQKLSERFFRFQSYFDQFFCNKVPTKGEVSFGILFHLYFSLFFVKNNYDLAEVNYYWYPSRTVPANIGH